MQSAPARGPGWPGVPIALPQVWIPTTVQLDGDAMIWNSLRSPPDPDPDLAIRELPNLNASDSLEVVSFIERNGVVEPRRPSRSLLPTRSDEDEHYTGLDRRCPHIADVGRFLQELRCLALHVVAVRSGSDPRHAWQTSSRPAFEISDASSNFVHFLNEFLRRFRVFVEDRWVAEGALMEQGPPDTVEFVVGRPSHDLIDLLAAQIHNLWVEEEVTIRSCAHCSSAFTRQIGRAQQGQHRVSGGVKYCSKRCAKNAGNRAYRARQRGDVA